MLHIAYIASSFLYYEVMTNILSLSQDITVRHTGLLENIYFIFWVTCFAKDPVCIRIIRKVTEWARTMLSFFDYIDTNLYKL